jgi:hypothetical protein
VVQSGLDGAGRSADAIRDLVHGQVFEESKGNDDPVIRVERSKGALDLVAIPESPEWISRARDLDLVGDVDDRVTALAPEPVATGIHDDAVEPGIELGRVLQLSPVAPRSEEGVMDRVLGVRPIAEDRTREAVCLVEAGGHEIAKDVRAKVGVRDRGRSRSTRLRRLRHPGLSLHADTTPAGCPNVHFEVE